MPYEGDSSSAIYALDRSAFKSFILTGMPASERYQCAGRRQVGLGKWFRGSSQGLAASPPTGQSIHMLAYCTSSRSSCKLHFMPCNQLGKHPLSSNKVGHAAWSMQDMQSSQTMSVTSCWVCLGTTSKAAEKVIHSPGCLYYTCMQGELRAHLRGGLLASDLISSPGSRNL